MLSTSQPNNATVRGVPEVSKPAPGPSPLETLLELIRRARSAESMMALRFIAANDSHLLAPYHQSALWLKAGGIVTLSGLTEVDANAPFAQWLSRACEALNGGKTRAVAAADLPAELQGQWNEWLPAHALWLPFGQKGENVGGMLFVRDLPWREIELRLFHEWIQTWFCAYRALSKPGVFTNTFRAMFSAPRRLTRKPLLWAIVAVAILLYPVRLTVLTPGELVPANPIAVRAPFDGVIKTFLVRTNQAVTAGQPLFEYDDAQLISKLGVASEALHTAETEQRQYGQQALNDVKARAALSTARGNVEEKRIEVEFLKDQLARSKVLAPQAGTAFVDDPSEWIGRPVSAGQRIMRLAEPNDKEIEAWLPVADAIILPDGSPARLYLSASPLSPVSGKIRLISYEASHRPEGHYAYRVRATLDAASGHRVGLKGTVRLTGGRVPLAYWALRRPLAALREFLGL